MEESGLPVLSGPIDNLRQGFQGLQLSAAQVAPHAVELIQRKAEHTYNKKLDMVRRTYGCHMAMRLATEQMVHDRDRRLPGLPSSHITCDTLAGTDTTIEFQDFLKCTQSLVMLSLLISLSIDIL